MTEPGKRNKLQALLKSLTEWTRKKTGDNTFLILAAILVGILSAFASTLLKIFVDLLRHLPEIFLKVSHTSLLYFFLPVSGILLTVLFVKIFLKGKLEKGVGAILLSIVKKSSVMEKSQMYSSIATSGLTVGLGGSAGLEAPIVMTCSAIGSNVAQALKLGFKERTLLLACGAAAAISAIFNSPIAGVIFAIEVLLIDLSIPLFIPLLIASATAAIVSRLLYSGQLFHLITTQWNLDAIPYYILLGVMCGFVSVYMTRVTFTIENFFESKKNIWLKAILGGLSLGGLIFIFPPLFGEGYVTITELLKGNSVHLADGTIFHYLTANPWFIVMLAAAIVLIKVVATSLTLGSGGNGGIFAPSLFTGALVGFVLSQSVNLSGIHNLQVTNFVAVGMAGIMAGVVHAPLTAIFLIAEISGGYMLFVPLMIVAATSYLISRYFEPYSIYNRSLALKGFLHRTDRNRNILSQFNLSDILETDFIPLNVNGNFRLLVEAFTRSKRNVFPVIASNGDFEGVINLDNVKEILFKPELFDTLKISEIMKSEMLVLDLNTDIETAVGQVEQTAQWNIPVTENGKYVGFVSRANILSYYRKILKKSATLF
jgi:chloride channel protein, CIC family